MLNGFLLLHSLSSLFLNQIFKFYLLQEVDKIVKEHDSSKPLFLYMAFENVHDPIQAPKKYLNKYNFIKDKDRRTYAAMMDVVDEAIGNITEVFKEKG